jgi:hypothetical protein
MDWMLTYSGRKFPVLDPQPEDFDIRDIAHGLSQQCRYAGQCIKFQSVAEHSTALWHVAKPEHKPWALLHDAPEAYIRDLPRMVKRNVHGFRELETLYEQRLAERFGLTFPIPPEVVDLDNRILLDERAQNMPAIGGALFVPVGYGNHHVHEMDGWPFDKEPLNIKIHNWTPQQAEVAFLAAFQITFGKEYGDGLVA